MDTYRAFSVADKMPMCNYTTNRLCCDAADPAKRVRARLDYSHHVHVEQIYRRHRITSNLFNFMEQQKPKGVAQT